MQAFDFIYDDISLSSMGYTVCNFDTDSSINTVTTDSQRTFQHATMFYGKYLPIYASSYSDHLELTFSVCRMPVFNNPDLTVDDIRFMKRWLNRPTCHKFKIIHEGFSGIYFEGTFNVTEMRFAGYVNGLELTFISNRPFALHEPMLYETDLLTSTDYLDIFDLSDEIGSIYPDIQVTCKSAGSLSIINSFDERRTTVANCRDGEIITFTPYLIIESNDPEHAVYDDFNFNFTRISNTLYEKKNRITSSLPCHIRISYSPIVKAVM